MAPSEKIPEGRLARFAHLASLGARAGMGLITKEDTAASAENLAKTLGKMRGLAAKAGQIASYVDGLIPPGNSAIYEKALAALRDDTPTTPFAEIAATIEGELGAPIGDFWSSFEERPIASASIGQVHLATLRDGREVVVKVQHPGIENAIESDLKSAELFEPIMALAQGRKVDSKQIFAEMATRLREELDYRLEAERQTLFRGFYEGDAGICVPYVVAECSSGRVLTSERVHGKKLEEVLGLPEGDRRRYAETLWRFVFKGNLVGGMFNADPHPGNYLFGEDGRVAFLDFGCVEPIAGERLFGARELHRVAILGDEAAFARQAARLLETKGGEWERLSIEFSRACFEPLFSDRFQITRPYVVSLVEKMKATARAVRALPKGVHVPVPKGMVFLNRLQFGFYSVLARLDVEVGYREVERGFLEAAGLWESPR